MYDYHEYVRHHDLECDVAMSLGIITTNNVYSVGCSTARLAKGSSPAIYADQNAFSARALWLTSAIWQCIMATGIAAIFSYSSSSFVSSSP